MASLPAIVSSLEYLLDIEIPEAAAEALLGEGLLQMGLAQGLLERNEAAYSLSMALDNGTLEVNGRALPLPGAAPAPPRQDGASPFEGAAPFPLEEDEPSPFDQARRPPVAVGPPPD